MARLSRHRPRDSSSPRPSQRDFEGIPREARRRGRSLIPESKFLDAPTVTLRFPRPPSDIERLSGRRSRNLRRSEIYAIRARILTLPLEATRNPADGALASHPAKMIIYNARAIRNARRSIFCLRHFSSRVNRAQDPRQYVPTYVTLR